MHVLQSIGFITLFIMLGFYFTSKLMCLLFGIMKSMWQSLVKRLYQVKAAINKSGA